MRHALALILTLVSAPLYAQADTVPDGTPALELTGRVVDAADLLDSATEERIETKLEGVEHSYGVDFVLVTTPSLNGQSIENYAIDLARSWGIGGEAGNNGLVLLVAPTERRVRIEVGIGLEDMFTDEFAGIVLDNDVLPAFRAEEMVKGINAGVDRLIEKMKAAPTLPANDNASPIAEDVSQ